MVEDDRMADVLFYQLVMGLHGSAWMALGKVASPVTGGVERNLEAAKATIDTLTMLKVKTVGNLSKEEEGYLSNILQQLQLNYVDEVDKSKAESVEGAKAREELKEEKPAEETSTPKKEKKEDTRQTKGKGKSKPSKK